MLGDIVLFDLWFVCFKMSFSVQFQKNGVRFGIGVSEDYYVEFLEYEWLDFLFIL